MLYPDDMEHIELDDCDVRVDDEWLDVFDDVDVCDMVDVREIGLAGELQENHREREK